MIDHGPRIWSNEPEGAEQPSLGQGAILRHIITAFCEL